MGESVKSILDREMFWGSWKDNNKSKCFNFERPVCTRVQDKLNLARKRDKKMFNKIMISKSEVQGLQFNLVNNGKALSKILR